MPQQNALERMNELIRSLQQAMGRLGEGKLDLADLEQSTEDARAIYERLVVLRHKAREAAMGMGGPAEGKGAGNAPGAVAEAVGKAEVEEGAIRLDTRPIEASPQQTSLIDAIAETETGLPKPVAEAPRPEAKPKPKAKPKAEAKAKPKTEPKPEPRPKPKAEAEAEKKAAAPPAEDRPITVADKMEHAPVADLRKAIALSQKFWFVAELFEGERDRYEKAIDAINGMGSRKEAEAYMQQEIIAKLPKPPGEEVAATFTDLLQRRFS